MAARYLEDFASGSATAPGTTAMDPTAFPFRCEVREFVLLHADQFGRRRSRRSQKDS